FPSKVRRLFLIGTTPHFRRAWREANLRAFRMMVKRKGIEAFRDIALERPFSDRVDTGSALRMLEDYINLDLTHILPLIGAETYIIHGEGDRVVPVGEALKMRSLLKRSKLIILPGGHLPVRYEGDFISKIFEVR
ncbi:MAG: alpha/beta hydrolase, partial [Aquificota bacterium]|nr:alpha/beta hydrolase [Aquificota bacterium]